MRIACTGTSSTGKTTFAKRAAADDAISKHAGLYITADARELLRQRGLRSVDEMSAAQLRDFQQAYLQRKTETEKDHANYITDRSFVDVAAYWILYTNTTDPGKDPFVLQCRSEAQRYALHLYFPPGLIEFEYDGARSSEPQLHQRIDELIRSLLEDWGITPLKISIKDIEQRLLFLREHLTLRI